MTVPAGIDGVARELAALVERLETGTADEDSLLSAMEGLRTSVEQLRVADEDLTQQAEELIDVHSLVDSERRRYEDLFASAPIPYLVTDLMGTIQQANAASVELFRVPQRFLEGKPVTAFVSVHERQHFRRLVLHVGTSPITIDVRMERRGGVPFDAALTFRRVPDRSGIGGESLRWTIRDVTDERQSERRMWELNAELEKRVEERTVELTAIRDELAAQRAQFEAVIQNLPAAVVVADDRGHILIRNSRADELFGRGIERLETLAELFVDSERLMEMRPVTAGSRGANGSGGSLALPQPDGSQILLEATVARVRGARSRGNLLYVFHDVTAQRRRDVAQREFVVNAAHELRTPLAAIVSAIEVLQAGGKNDPETRDLFLAHLERESARLVRLARSLLLLSRAQSHEERPALAIVPLSQVLADIADGVHPAPGVTVEIDCDDELAALFNEDLLRQALSSLVDNAVQFTRRGTITLRAYEHDERRVAVEIVDTGPGLSHDERSLVTHRFVRGARSSDGFGLGLSIAAEAARAAGGELELEAREGGGTTARIVVQLARLVSV